MMLSESYKKCGVVCAAILVCAAVILSAGCVSEEKAFTYTRVAIPDDMEAAQTALLDSLKGLDLSVTLDLYYLADQAGAAEDEDEVISILDTYYATHSWLNRIVFYSNASGEFLEYPVESRGGLLNSVPVPTKEELLAAGGILNLGPVLVSEKGWMELMYAPVFSPSGEYKGYLLVLFDLQTTLRGHELLYNTETGYDTYTIMLVNRNGKVTYSTQQEFIGFLTDRVTPLNTGVSRILLQNAEKSGAYRYETISGTVTTAWQQYSAHKNTYTLYLTRKETPQPVNFEDILTPQPDAVREAVVDLWKYAGDHGREAVLDRINAGYYPYTLYGIDRNGTILAAPPERQYAVGRNYLNVYDMYGVAFVQQAVYTANQGGGYVMYFDPAETTWVSEASEFRVGYVMPVDEDLFVAGVSPGETHLLPSDYTARADVVSVSRAIVEYADTYGVNATVEKINAVPGGNGTLFVEGIPTNVSSIGLIDYDGLMYTATYIPSYIGKSGTSYTDILGSSVFRRSMLLAKSGGGMIYDYQWSQERPGYCEVWLYSVEPVNQKFFIMSGAVVAVVKNSVQDGIIPQP